MAGGSVIIAIDPGTTQSAYLVMVGGKIDSHGKVSHEEIISIIRGREVDLVVCEMIASYGMPVGAEIFDTCLWIGEYRRTCKSLGIAWEVITRNEVKQRLCHRTSKVNDAVIRQRLLDMYGGKALAIGNKANPGELYGIKADVWAALAVVKTWEANPASNRNGTP